ncbi:MAG: Hsp20/alpha crystallin family protein [Candidatus Latescibacterota bacterium]|nr:MAG: Hsp20/alpha crystallin family protein [Candidatus Latescibacterota bacterium]
MTNITRWDPFRELLELSERLNRVFGGRQLTRSGERKESLSVADWAPTVDITESVEEYLIKAELPEIRKEDVKITVQDGVLTIQGERRQEKEEKGKKHHRIERSYGKFVRSFEVPDDADEPKIQANFDNGMLYLHVPKSATAKPKAIEVKIG